MPDSRRHYPLQVPSWRAIPGLAHGFLGRAHGLGGGDFSLDDLRAPLRRAGANPPLVAAARQVHGSTVLAPEDFAPLATADFSAPLATVMPAGDALVSASADLLLTIRTADCVPILLVAPRARAVAAVHAGWRGTVAGVVEAALDGLTLRYGARPDEVLAAIGPAIGACCYEFGAEQQREFVARFGGAASAAWRPSAADPQRGLLDIRALCRLALERAGVPATAITDLDRCTVHHPDELHSFRRDSANAGRQLSYIGWVA